MHSFKKGGRTAILSFFTYFMRAGAIYSTQQKKNHVCAFDRAHLHLELP